MDEHDFSAISVVILVITVIVLVFIMSYFGHILTIINAIAQALGVNIQSSTNYIFNVFVTVAYALVAATVIIITVFIYRYIRWSRT